MDGCWIIFLRISNGYGNFSFDFDDSFVYMLEGDLFPRGWLYGSSVEDHSLMHDRRLFYTCSMSQFCHSWVGGTIIITPVCHHSLLWLRPSQSCLTLTVSPSHPPLQHVTDIQVIKKHSVFNIIIFFNRIFL